MATAEMVFVAYDFKTAGGVRDDLQAARDKKPLGFDIHFAAQEDDPISGEIWRDRLRPKLLEAPRIVAYVDLPNANVGFEIGFALGQGPGKKMILARAGAGDPPPWSGLPPLAGFLSARFQNGPEILAAIANDQNWYASPARPELGSKIVLLCPRTAGGSYEDLFEGLGWTRPAFEGWNLNDLPRVLKDVGAVVWVILPHKDGPQERDGGENAALSIIAGYCHACSVPLSVLKHSDSRVVVDVAWSALEFKNRQQLQQKLPAVSERLREEVKAREPKLDAKAPPRVVRRPEVGGAPTMSFGDVKERFVGREVLLGDLREALRGLSSRQAGEKTEGPRDVRVAWYFGYGGMGKSYFLRRATLEAREQVRDAKVGLVDWDDGASEFRQPLTHPPLTANDVLQPIAYRLAQLYGAEALDPFWSVCQRVDVVQEVRARLRQSYQEQMDRLRRGEDVGQALRTVLMAKGLAVSGPERDKTVEALQAPTLREETFVQWYDQGGGAVGDRDAALDPDGLRLKVLQDCIAAVSSVQPLVLALDTYEILQMAEQADLDGWLRKLIVPLCQGQLPFMVIVASRLPPDTGTRPGVRDSWRERLEGVRLRSAHFDEAQRFTPREIASVAAKLTHVSDPPPDLVERIHRVTLGVPLAVRILFDECAGDPQALEIALGEEDARDDDDGTVVRPEEIVVAQMTGRFLLHLQGRSDRRSDYHAIVALALLREIDHEILGQMWPGVRVGTRLRELASRYGLVGRGDLHATVRKFLRQHWLPGDRNRDVEEMIDALVKAVDSLPLPNQTGDSEYFRAIGQRLNAHLWAKGAGILSEVAPVLCLALAFDEHVDELLALVHEIPLPKQGRMRDVVGMLHTLVDRGFWLAPWQETGLMRWLTAERKAAFASWSKEENAALLLLEGLGLVQEEKHRAAAGPLLEALECFQRLPAIPRSSELGEALFQIGLKLDGAADQGQLTMRVYDAAASAGYDQASCVNNKGKTLGDVGLTQEAEAVFRQAIALNPRESLYHRNLAITLNLLGRHADAETSFRKAIEVDPGSIDSYTGLAAMLSRHARSTEAEAVLRQGVDANPRSADALSGLGEHLRDHGDLDGAERAYARAVEIDDRHSDAHNGLGAVLHERGTLARAEAEYRQAIALSSTEPKYHRNLGLLQKQAGHLAEAEASYRKALEIRRSYSDAADSLAVLLEEQGRSAEAEAVLRQAAESNPNQPLAFIILARYLSAKDRLDEAQRAYERALALDSRDAYAHNGLGHVFQKRADLVRAEAEFREALALDAGEPSFHRNLGFLLEKTGRAAAAEAAYREALVIRPTYSSVADNLAKLLDASGRSAEAEAVLRRCVELAPGRADAFVALGDYLKKKKRLDEARRAYDRALVLAPEQARYHNLLGNVLCEMSEWELGERAYLQGITLDAKEPIYRRNLGVLLEKVGRAGDAEAAFREALRIDPTYTAAAESLAGVLEAGGRVAEVEALLRGCAEAEPRRAGGFVAVGNHLRRQGDLEGAVHAYEQALALAPRDASVHNVLANALLEGGIMPRAEAEYRQAIALDDKEPIYLRNLGLLLENARRLEDAETFYRQALDLSSTYTDAAEDLARLLSAGGRSAEAEALLRRGAEASPECAQAYVALGNHLREKGRLPEAARAIERGVALAPKSHRAHGSLGNVYFDLGDMEKAEAEYREAIALEPVDSTHHRNLAQALERAGNLADAESAYRAALARSPGYIGAANELSSLLERQQRLAEAEGVLRHAMQAAKSDSDRGNALNSLAWLFYKQELDVGEALALAQEAAKLVPHDAAVLHTLATVSLKAHGWDQAREAVRAWVSHTDGASLDKQELWETFQIVVAAGRLVELCELLSSSGRDGQWKAWVEAIQSGRNKPPR